MTFARSTIATVAVCVALGGCGVPGQNTPTQLDDNQVRVPAPGTTTSLPKGTPTQHFELCLISDHHLTATLPELPTPLSVAGTLKALIDAPQGSLPVGTRSALNDPNVVSAKDTTNGTANIDLNSTFTEIAPTDQLSRSHRSCAPSPACPASDRCTSPKKANPSMSLAPTAP